VRWCFAGRHDLCCYELVAIGIIGSVLQRTDARTPLPCRSITNSVTRVTHHLGLL